jgi:hypothetical protein
MGGFPHGDNRLPELVNTTHRKVDRHLSEQRGGGESQAVEVIDPNWFSPVGRYQRLLFARARQIQDTRILCL